jgi:hypothetical protein
VTADQRRRVFGQIQLFGLAIGFLMAWGCGHAPAPTTTAPSPTTPTPPNAPQPDDQINACGIRTGNGPFRVVADIKGSSKGCLTFQNSIGASLDCQNHDVTSITVSNAQGFSIRNCSAHFGGPHTVEIFSSDGVALDTVDVTGQVVVQGSRNTMLANSTFRYPVLPPSPAGFISCEVCLDGGDHNTVSQSVVDGGWDGNRSTYQTQGCDDGVLVNNETNATITGNTIRSAFDAGVESSASSIPITVTVTNNTITNVGYAAIGGYYVPGWQNSRFSGNTVINTPTVIYFEGVTAQHSGTATSFTLVNNLIEGNSLQSPVRWPPFYGSVQPPSLSIDYVAPGLPFTVNGNVIRNNNFGTATRGPFLAPVDGFVDGGGNICQPTTGLACAGGG